MINPKSNAHNHFLDSTMQVNNSTSLNISNFGENNLNIHQKKGEQKRGSIIYETLVVKLREEAKNPSLNDAIKEVSENSLQSDSSVEEENNERLRLPFNQTIRIVEEQNEEEKSAFREFKSEQRPLAIVPEENESMYSAFFGGSN